MRKCCCSTKANKKKREKHTYSATQKRTTNKQRIALRRKTIKIKITVITAVLPFCNLSN